MKGCVQNGTLLALKRSMLKKHLSTFVLLGFLFSCGGGDSGNSDEFEREDEQVPEPETLQRIYRTDLKSVNPRALNNVKGQTVIRLEDDSFEVNIAVQNVPGSIHPQKIHVAKNCPGPQSDTNRDGFIDVVEAEAVSGAVYIPLDGDLDNVSEDARTYPNGGFLRGYVYREETSRSRLLADMRTSNFLLEDKVVMVFGVDDDEELPPTVASRDGRPAQETLPIACGELFRVIGQ